MSAIERRESVDVLRLRRFKAGETLQEIAADAGVTIGTVLTSIQRAAAGEQMLLLFRLAGLKLQGAIDNELIRQQLRRMLSEKFAKAIELLLSGKHPVISTDPITGEVRIEEIIDPKVIAMGVEHYRKATSLEEKPVPNPITVNIQDNQGGSIEGAVAQDFSYEERLEGIRVAQDEAALRLNMSGHD